MAFTTAFATPVTFGGSNRVTSVQACPRRVRVASISMAAEEPVPKKKQSIVDWVLSKFMPFQWLEDEIAFEPFHKSSMTLREEEMERQYQALKDGEEY